jgi:type I restriction enzyme R subunit
MEVVRNISDHARKVGSGNNYLIQHSAGSGKSNSIAWLAYRLSSLHDAVNNRIFDSVIVITDRKVLDNQLQNTIYQFEHKQGVVQKIDKDSQQLADAITSGSNIIITTLQKFPFVLDKVSELNKKKYAVIIDEAHSSQGGEATKKMKEVLAAKTLEEAATEESDSGLDEDAEDGIRKSMEARGKQENLSFFAFTGNPGEIDHPKPEQIDHLKGWRKLIKFAGEDF